jgi:hypothetical protein
VTGEYAPAEVIDIHDFHIPYVLEGLVQQVYKEVTVLFRVKGIWKS